MRLPWGSQTAAVADMDRAVFDSVEREIDDEVLARFRQKPEYEQLRERVREIGRLRAEC